MAYPVCHLCKRYSWLNITAGQCQCPSLLSTEELCLIKIFSLPITSKQKQVYYLPISFLFPFKRTCSLYLSVCDKDTLSSLFLLLQFSIPSQALSVYDKYTILLSLSLLLQFSIHTPTHMLNLSLTLTLTIIILSLAK